MTKLFPAQRSVAMPPRSGLTLLEVIFAMMVLLVGLVSVGLLIPLAGRQAADSYQITQGLAAGESAMAMVNTAQLSQPTLDSPWCLRHDASGLGYSVGSIKEAYERVALMTFPAPPGTTLNERKINAAIAQNESIGIGFCIDPLFWGYQNRVATDLLPDPFERTRFPCIDDSANPVTLSTDPSRAPRLRRISLSDPQISEEWLRQPIAVNLATMFGGDLVQVSPVVNRSSSPLRAVYASPGSGNPLSRGLTSIDAPSWLMTVTPDENTPIIPLYSANQNFDGTQSSNRPVQIANTYNVAVVVFSKRDVRDINPAISPSLQTLPVSERVFRVFSIGPEALTSGSFTVTLDSSLLIDPKIKIGDWLMMSRFTKQDLLPRSPGTNQAISRQVHHWYRVVSLTDEQLIRDTNPPFDPVLIRRSIRVSGKPWDWTSGEINDLRERGQPMPVVPPLPSVIETHAVLLQNVVQVFERQIEMQ